MPQNYRKYSKNTNLVLTRPIYPATVRANIREIGGNEQWKEIVEQCVAELDSTGGIVECTVEGLPVGLGEPFFDGVESVIGHIVLAIPAIKGIEFGAGFAAARMSGSEHNDSFISIDGKTATNHAGGINGGITNGNTVVFRVAVKPTSSIAKPQQTINMRTGKMTNLEIAGRHDNCIALRMPPVLESATAIALADLKLRT